MSYKLFINVAAYIHLQKHAVTVVITYYVLLIKDFKAIATFNFNILITFILSFVFLQMLSSIFFCVIGSVLIYIIKFIIEINIVIKLAHK